MKNQLLISLFVVASLAATSCKPETKIAGHPVSHWIERLEDANPKTRNEAWRQLHFASDDDIRKNKKAFEKIADSQSVDAERAVLMLYERLEEANIKWIPFYIEGIPQNSYYCGKGAMALKQLELTDRNAVVSGLEKYISEGAQGKSYSSARYLPASKHLADAEDYLRNMNKK